jgi:hypothetical protein
MRRVAAQAVGLGHHRRHQLVGVQRALHQRATAPLAHQGGGARARPGRRSPVATISKSRAVDRRPRRPRGGSAAVADQQRPGDAGARHGRGGLQRQRIAGMHQRQAAPGGGSAGHGSGARLAHALDGRPGRPGGRPAQRVARVEGLRVRGPQTKSLYFSSRRTGMASASRRKGSPSSRVHMISTTQVLRFVHLQVDGASSAPGPRPRGRSTTMPRHPCSWPCPRSWGFRARRRRSGGCRSRPGSSSRRPTGGCGRPPPSPGCRGARQVMISTMLMAQAPSPA